MQDISSLGYLTKKKKESSLGFLMPIQMHEASFAMLIVPSFSWGTCACVLDYFCFVIISLSQFEISLMICVCFR